MNLLKLYTRINPSLRLLFWITTLFVLAIIHFSLPDLHSVNTKETIEVQAMRVFNLFAGFAYFFTILFSVEALYSMKFIWLVSKEKVFEIE